VRIFLQNFTLLQQILRYVDSSGSGLRNQWLALVNMLLEADYFATSMCQSALQEGLWSVEFIKGGLTEV
jgi:hypothetical protein